jgi:hypothetical protein
VKLAVPPGLTVALVGLPGAAPTLKSVPSPASGILCGLPLAFELTLTVAVRLPVPVGRNVTVITQLPPPLMPVPQLSLRTKSPAFAPPSVMLVMVRVAPPGLLRVTLCPALLLFTNCGLNTTDVGANETDAAVTPVPERTTQSGLLVAFVTTLT